MCKANLRHIYNGEHSFKFLDFLVFIVKTETKHLLMLNLDEFWNDKTIEQYTYTYYVWLGKCPFCLWDVKEGQVQELEGEGLAICSKCKSKIEVNWMGIGKYQFQADDIEDVIPCYKELLFDDVCDLLKLREYFIFTIGFEDIDEFDNFTNLLIENPDIVKRFRTPSAKTAFLCQADTKTQGFFGFRNLDHLSVILLAVAATPPAVGKEDGRLLSYVKDKDREDYARRFRLYYDEILSNHTFDIDLEE
jgi:hypothetical protein